MADTGAVAAPKKNAVTKMSGWVGNHPTMALGILVVLALMLIYTVVYYRGLLFLGPYAANAAKTGFKSGRKKKEAAAEDGGEEVKGDPETERLIESINKHG